MVKLRPVDCSQRRARGINIAGFVVWLDNCENGPGEVHLSQSPPDWIINLAWLIVWYCAFGIFSSSNLRRTQRLHASIIHRENVFPCKWVTTGNLSTLQFQPHIGKPLCEPTPALRSCYGLGEPHTLFS